MSITIALPSALQPFAGGRAEVRLDAHGDTVADVLGALADRHGGVVDRVMDETGRVRQHVNVFVDGDNIRFLEGLRTLVAEGSTIVIVPAVSGG
ncbi:MAG TPA: ubiquitin-like small modifier protein 1 [Longimicrobium sp.]|nr:ubiquitin-like small modifier protein 1 [Longimicrobium sp.]